MCLHLRPCSISCNTKSLELLAQQFLNMNAGTVLADRSQRHGRAMILEPIQQSSGCITFLEGPYDPSYYVVSEVPSVPRLSFPFSSTTEERL